jgi:predicted ABC-type ATPase
LNQPNFTIIAGPNGAGKSTLTSGNPEFFATHPLLDPDVLAKTIQADALNSNPFTAGREVLEKVRMHLNHLDSFALETTLSGKIYFETMRHAKSRGFKVGLVYIGTSDVAINLLRIAKRVGRGGHNVPEVDVRRRYERSLSHLLIAAHLADFTILFDNSTANGYQQIALIQAGEAIWFEPIPTWALPLKTSF